MSNESEGYSICIETYTHDDFDSYEDACFAHTTLALWEVLTDQRSLPFCGIPVGLATRLIRHVLDNLQTPEQADESLRHDYQSKIDHLDRSLKASLRSHKMDLHLLSQQLAEAVATTKLTQQELWAFQRLQNAFVDSLEKLGGPIKITDTP